MIEELLDHLGQTISVGSYVVYTVSSGRTAVLKVGKIVSIDEDGGEMRAVTVDSSWRHRGPELQYKGRPLPLSKPQCMVVVPRASVPEKVLELLG